MYSVHDLGPTSDTSCTYFIRFLPLGEIDELLYSAATIIRLEVALRVRRDPVPV